MLTRPFKSLSFDSGGAEKALLALIPAERLDASWRRVLARVSSLPTYNGCADGTRPCLCEVFVSRGVSQARFSLFRSVETGLAKEVLRFVWRAHVLVRNAVETKADEFVTASVFALHSQCRDILLGFSQRFLELIDLVTSGRLLFLQRQRCILDVDHAIIDRLLHLGEFQFIASCDCCLCKIDSVLQAGNSCRDSHDRHLVPRREMGHPRPQRNHHSALAAEACVSGEFA